MQNSFLNQVSLKSIERGCFEFLWNKKHNKSKAYERINRHKLKLFVSEGGINAPDIYSLDKALKVRQYIRSSQDNEDHSIYSLQKLNLGLDMDRLYNSKTCNSFVNHALSGLSDLGIIVIKEMCDSNSENRLHKHCYNLIASADIVRCLKFHVKNKIALFQLDF
jgi:hypothetical protein